MNTATSNVKQRVLSSAKWTGVAKLFGQGLTFATTLYLARVLDKADFGIYALALLFMSIVETFTDFGIQGALIQRKDLSLQQLSATFWFLVAMSLGLIAIALPATSLVANLLNEPKLSEILPTMTAALLFAPVTIVCGALLARDLKLDTSAKIELLSGIVRCGLLIYLAAIGLGLWSFIYSYLAERLVLAVGLAHFCRWHPRFYTELRPIRPIIRFGATMMSARMLWLLYSKMDTFFIGRILGTEILGIYSIANQIAMSFSQFISATHYRVMFPLFAKYQDSDQRGKILLLSSVYLSLVALPVYFGLSAVADEMITVFLGVGWEQSAKYLQVLSIVAAMLTLSGLLPQAINAAGRADITVWINLVSIPLFGAGFYFGAETYGINGVLYAWLILMPFRYLANVVSACKMTQLKISTYFSGHIGPLISAFLMFLAVSYFLTQTSVSNIHLRLILGISLGILCYLTCLLVFSRKEVQEILAMIRSRNLTVSKTE